MPVVAEKFGSRSSTESAENPSIELLYNIYGTNDDLLAKFHLAAASPLTYDGLFRQSYSISQVGDNLWEGVVPYGTEKPPETGDSSYSFDTGGGTQHITQSIETIQKKAPPGKTAPDFKGAIGVTTDSVEGVDVVTPVYNWTETHFIANDAVTQAYKAKLFNLTGRVNDGTFRGFAAGEVLFQGASGSKRGKDDHEITFRFAASPNVTSLTIGDITGIDKKGWEYLWVRYEDSDDATAKRMVKKPLAAYVEKVYEDGDFSELGIGT